MRLEDSAELTLDHMKNDLLESLTGVLEPEASSDLRDQIVHWLAHVIL